MRIREKHQLTEKQVDRIIQMAWEDRTPFEAIEEQFAIKEKEVIRLMRQEMKMSSWKLWRKRVNGRKSKHSKLRMPDVNRFRCKTQKDSV